MTIDEIKALDSAGIAKRMADIKVEMEAEGADIDALTAEVEAIEARTKELAESAAKFANLKEKMINTGKPVENAPKENRTMKTIDEIRNSQEYIHAYANYIKTGKDVEARAILTENTETASTAKLPVPEVVDNAIKHAWDTLQILSRVTRTELKGNVKVGVETAASDAEVHTEGGTQPNEEQLTIKIVKMVPETIKKWVTVSDETLDLDDGAFLEYIYNELAYKIFKKAEDEVVADIVADTDELGTVVVPQGAITDFITAVSTLSDEATEPVVIINKASYAYYKGLKLAAGYDIDVFDGMRVLFNNNLDAVTGGDLAAGTYGIVGDLRGAQVNFPHGTDVQFKYDDLSLAEKDMVKIVGRLPVGHGIIAPKRFAVLKK
jgi:HK97 family phage major capsid protein